MRLLPPTSIVCLVLVVAATPARPAVADVIVFEDGRTIRGEVLDETDYKVEFRYRKDGTWTTETFSRRGIEAIYAEAGDQSDRHEREGQPIFPKRSADPARASESASTDATGPLVAYIPLYGPVGVTVDGKVSGSFDASLVQACLERAAESGAIAVVLDIQSPGGLVDEMEAICETIIDWRDRLRIVAWPGDAFSAAAIITMTCPQIIVRPDSLFGAATIVAPDGDAMTAIEAKMASPHYARQRQYMQHSGHPYEVVAAMTIQETRLWWSKDDGFTTDEPSDRTAWREVDSATSVLTVTAEDALRWNLADHEAEHLEDVIAALALGEESSILDLTDFVAQHNRALDRALDNVKDQFEIYIRGLANLNQNMGALFEAKKRGDHDRAAEMKRTVLREVGRIRGAGRLIQRADQTRSSAKVKIPPEMVARVREDAELLAEMARSLRAETTESWNEAARGLARVLREWKGITIGG